ncbi:TIGR03087 family PEP-CTERM/XrtA system glycosyltransferase [Neptunomonas marina]|uniref:TIGR03087 family PEP-CTERM/XrtA system glycosyltransferase n=1 Tax=Neptunomonas marina TaxID=1815562 RepID=A0A437Q8C7_9GAMM|nr:TIGR03087 family PEP-CTERM/XrtA system glycosyltransferase [Neptunomonas marina]RVU30758.1 TIGR03087 family PEP-CTERM/XrtA system glycosyltransferase [Neptunomonas marina]
MKPSLLLLCHRIPFPPNKGDKIRAFNLLKYLVKHYRVYLGCFIDDEQDWAYTEELEAMCEECLFIGINPTVAKVRSLRGLLTGQALSVPYYANQELSRWVVDINQRKGVTKAVAFSSPMAQFLDGDAVSFEKTVLDLVDIDSDKWAQYAEKKSWPMSWVYRREAKYLFNYEEWIAKSFDASLFVSSTEAQLFREMLPAYADKIGFYNNGVDSEFFRPRDDYPSVYGKGEVAVVFTGAMDYWPNIDAVTWFVEEVLPTLKARFEALTFYIVGSNPASSVKQLDALPGVKVTGRVDDIRPYIAQAAVSVAPMRIARGIQNKVLEAMAMETPVVVSDMGLEGISAIPEQEVLLANTAQEVIDAVVRIVETKHTDMGKAARSRVIADFSWESSLPTVKTLLDSAAVVS